MSYFKDRYTKERRNLFWTLLLVLLTAAAALIGFSDVIVSTTYADASAAALRAETATTQTAKPSVAQGTAPVTQPAVCSEDDLHTFQDKLTESFLRAWPGTADLSAASFNTLYVDADSDGVREALLVLHSGMDAQGDPAILMLLDREADTLRAVYTSGILSTARGCEALTVRQHVDGTVWFFLRTQDAGESYACSLYRYNGREMVCIRSALIVSNGKDTHSFHIPTDGTDLLAAAKWDLSSMPDMGAQGCLELWMSGLTGGSLIYESADSISALETLLDLFA